MMNPDADDYTKTLHHRKTLRKTNKQPTENQTYTKLEYPVMHLACQGWRFAPLAPHQLYHCFHKTVAFVTASLSCGDELVNYCLL